MGHTATKILLAIVGLLGGLYAIVGVVQLIGALSRTNSTPYGAANIAASVVPVCLGLIVCVACFQYLFKRGHASRNRGTGLSHPGVYIEEIPAVRTITGVATSAAAFVGSAAAGPVDEPVSITSLAEFEQTFGGLGLESRLGFSVRDFFLNGGRQAIVIRVNQGSSGTVSDADFVSPEKEAASQGLYALKNADLFNVLAIPPYNQQDNVDTNVLAAAVKLCEDRRAFLLVDSPSHWTTTEMARDGLAALGIQSSNAALFFPRLRMPNPLRNNQVEDFPASGAIAGVYARSDADRGVWKAAAGRDATLAGNPQLAVAITDSDQNVLNPLGLNCLRTFPDVGTVIWGSRTLQGADESASEWKYVPVRRLFLFVEESIDRGTQWTVFEPNGEPLWAALRSTIAAFLHGLFQQGAFQGRVPEEAYFVRCDRETMTQGDIDEGRVIVLVGFAPLKPAEFVIFRIQRMTASA